MVAPTAAREVCALALGVVLAILAGIACAPASAPAPPAAPRAPAPAAGGGTGAAPPVVAAAVAPQTAGGPVSTIPPLNPPVSVNVGVLGIFPDAGVYIAYEKGYFTDEGLDVTFHVFRSGAEMMPAIVSNQLQVGSGALDPSLFNAVARDLNVKIVADKSRNSATHGTGAVVVRQDLYDTGTVNELGKLKGRLVAMSSPSGIVPRYLELALERAGLTLNDITTTILPFPDHPAALANGSIDAAWMNEPFVAVAVERGYGRSLVHASELYPTLYTNLLLLPEGFAQQQPEAARRFVTAHLRAQRDFYRAFVLGEGDRQEIVQILVKHTGVKDPALYDKMSFQAVEPNGYVDPVVIADLQDYFASKGYVREKVDVSKVIDRQYIEYALQRLGTLPDPYR